MMSEVEALILEAVAEVENTATEPGAKARARGDRTR